MNSSILSLLYGEKAKEIAGLKILLVGVGGIGCEVLKCLAKLPINSLHILDLDTIQISNLNRQFLFQFKHRNHSKALTARETILALNSNINITAHHANIKEMEASFFRKFNLVIMALDNAEARSFVNEVCVILGIPIVDAGTSGYNGQVHFIQPRLTSCFDCEPKGTNTKVFQVCTIRTRPDKPIHCITWAKFLFQALFGPYDEGNLINDMSKLGIELKENSSLERVNAFVQQIFSDDIKKLITQKSKPITDIPDIELESYTPLEFSSLSEASFTTTQPIQFHINSFKTSLFQLLKIAKTQEFLTFQKDDPIIMSFISSASNLRMHIFNIPMMPFYEVKETAGNIIPAIASTNSIVAGLEITESIKYIIGNTHLLRSVYLKTGSQKLGPMKPQKPNIQCKVCSAAHSPVLIEKSFNHLTLLYLIELIQANKPDLDFSINMKIGSKDKYQLKELMNLADFQDGLLKKEYLQRSMSNFDKEKKIIQCFVINEDTGNMVSHIYLMDNSDFKGDQEILDLQGFSNEEIILNLKVQKQEEKKQLQPLASGSHIVLEDSQDDDSLCIIQDHPEVTIEDIKDKAKLISWESSKSLKRDREDLHLPETNPKRLKLD